MKSFVINLRAVTIQPAGGRENHVGPSKVTGILNTTVSCRGISVQLVCWDDKDVYK